MDPKPELSLLPGDLAFSVDDLALFFEKLTGRKPTAEEIEEARRYLAENGSGPSSDAVESRSPGAE